jgi:ribosomal protein S18 acetylase RimI-like enzyme
MLLPLLRMMDDSTRQAAPFEIGPARPDEYEAIGAMCVGAYEEFAGRIEPALWEAMRANILDVAGLAREAEILVARDGGAVLGSTAYYPPGRTIPPLPPEWASVRTVAVSPAARGRGVGEALMRACIDRAREDGAPVLGLYTGEIMAAARALYGKLGFVRDAVLPPRHGMEAWRYRLDL